jgi:uncharacterized alkaline shock family protein YloU
MESHAFEKGSAVALVISPEVIAKIALTAAKAVDGVGAIEPIAQDAWRFLRPNDNRRFVKISNDSRGMTIQLCLRLCPTAKIARVAGEVQRRVKEAVQDMTGKVVSNVHIVIGGITL